MGDLQVKTRQGQDRVMVKEWLGTGKVDKIRLLEPLKSLVVGGGGWVVEKVIIVSVYIYYFSYFN